MQHLQPIDYATIIKASDVNEEVVSANWDLLKSSCGYQGIYNTLELKGKCGKVYLYFVKSVPSCGPRIDKYYEDLNCYFKEGLIYTKVLTQLTRVMQMKVAPECVLVKLGKAIVLEELFSQGWNHREITDISTAHAALKCLATLHAGSLILEKRSHKTLVELFPEVCFETFFHKNPEHSGRQCWNTFVKTSTSILYEYFKGAEKAIAALESVPSIVEPSSVYKNCLTHGDVWKNNAFFRGEECLWVDFSSSRYAPPALDVVCFIHLSDLSIYESSLRAFYYHYLCDLLEGLGAERMAEKEFEDSCSHYRVVALSLNCLNKFLTRMPRECTERVTRSPEAFFEFSVLGDNEMVLQALRSSDEYRNALLPTFKTLIDYCQTYF